VWDFRDGQDGQDGRGISNTQMSSLGENDASLTSVPHKQMPAATTIPIAPGGIKSYYQAKIESAEILINQKTQNLRRLEAQRNALNARGQYITIKRSCRQREINTLIYI
jgi:hypothetical protein